MRSLAKPGILILPFHPHFALPGLARQGLNLEKPQSSRGLSGFPPPSLHEAPRNKA